MRPTFAVHSGAPTRPAPMGWWGDMGGPKQKGIYSYSVSPFAQKPMKGALDGWLFWGLRRIAGQVPYFIVPFTVGYGVYVWGGNKYAYFNSKEGHHAIAVAEGHAH